MTDAELERGIEAAPDDPAPYLVYGDWLQSKGDPRGELIAVQAALLEAKGTEFARLKIREEALLDEHADLFFGEISSWPVRRTETDWFCGFIRALRGDRPTAMSRTPVSFLAHPSCRFVRELTGFPLTRPPPMLARLEIAKGDLSWVWSASRLRRLEVEQASAPMVRAGPIVHPWLSFLSVAWAGELAEDLRTAKLPALEALRLLDLFRRDLAWAIPAIERLDPDELGIGLRDVVEPDDLQPIADRIAVLHVASDASPLAKLVRLEGVRELRASSLYGGRDGFWRALPEMPALRKVSLETADRALAGGLSASPMAGRMEELEIALGDRLAAEALAEGRFGRLRRLRVEWTGLRSGIGEDELWVSGGLEAVREVEVEAFNWTARHLRALARSPMAPRLESLTAWIEEDEDAEALLESRPRFERLRKLVLAGDRALSPDRIQALFDLDLDVVWAPRVFRR